MSLSVEALQGSHVSSYDTQKTGAAVDPKIPDEQISQKHVTHPGEAPDGGIRAWLVVFAAASVMFSTLGFLLSWGIFQAYYEENLLLHTSPSTIAWIGSTQYALACLPSLATGRMFDLGYFKIPFFAATCVLVACTFLTAECTQFWQFFLTQGVGVGVSCGIMWNPAVVIVPQWFSKRRGLALSLTTIGTVLGSIVFPVAAQNLIPLIGFKWTVRVFGFILMATLGTANVLLKRRLPPVNIRGGLFNFNAFRNKAFTIYCISGIMIVLGLDTELTYLPVSAVAIGVSKDFSFYTLAIANAASALRVSFGLMSDKIGAINTMVVMTAVTGIATIVWPFAKNESQLIAIAAIYGFSLGAYVSLYSAPLVAMGQMEDAGRRVGMFMSLIALGGAAGPPISGAISTATGGFVAAGYYSGGSIIFGVALLLVARYLHLGRLWGKF
ncbi:major facilitator superfamily domain-containing protein [Suillus subalutaceus]|uniref:major facilitator superfamily domain-containing protein n=1 Tax=Suillus subalutaceus TaxID=48586 RepID=UPI001B868DBC|nr:major facilitator superfamily domain-containing protein [Suillus subalutaceus]KAG1863601.1 major facilitator superfamily domain-containing protein [Suillus subalutaceus]